MAGTTRVSCSVDSDVLKKVDEEAAARGKSRSSMVSELLERGMASPDGAPTGVFVEMSPYILAKLRAWAARTGEDDLAKALYDGFVEGVGGARFMSMPTEPCTAEWLAEMMSRPDAPTDGLAALWVDPASEGTMHPSLVYEPEPGRRYKSGAIMGHVGMTCRIVSAAVEDPIAAGYKEVYRRERG